MISQILAAILIAAVVVLLTWVYQRFHGQVPATPHPTLVSPKGNIEASQSGNPVPKPTTDQATSFEESQDEAGPKVSEHHEETIRPAATLKTDDNIQQQSDSHKPKATPHPTPVSPTTSIQASQQGSPDPNIVQEALSEETQDEVGPYVSEDTTRSAATLKTDEDPQQQADSQTPTAISPTHGSLEMDAVRLQPRGRVVVVAESDPNQHLHSARAELQEEESLPLGASGDFALSPVWRENSEASQRQSTYQETTVNSNETAARDELLQGASLAASAGPALSPTQSANSQVGQHYRNQDSISPDTEPTARQDLGPDHEGLCFAPPPPNWRFDDLLTDLNKMITTDELDTLKDKFLSSFRETAIEEINTPRDLFREMKHQSFLNANNILYLQAILMKLERQDLIERIIEYSRAENVLFFTPATEPPENGYKYVKVHLYLDKEYSKKRLTKLQCEIANILCCPSKYVCLVGVEPSKSLLVTIMLPEMYVDILVKYLDQNLLHDRFAALGIDTITIDEKVYEIEVCHKPVARRSDEQLLSLYHQLSNRDLQIEGMDNTCDQLHQKIQQLEEQEEAKTAQLAESEEKCKQLMAKVEMLENNVESKAALIEESEQKCKQLEQKIEDLGKQGASSNALLLKNQIECKQLEKRIESLEKQNTKLEQLEQVNKELKDSKEVLLQNIDFFRKEMNSLNNKIQERDKQLQQYKEKMETIYDCHDEYIDSLTIKLTQLESGIYGTTQQYGDSKYMQVDFQTLAAYYWKVRELQDEVIRFDNQQDSNIPSVDMPNGDSDIVSNLKDSTNRNWECASRSMAY